MNTAVVTCTNKDNSHYFISFGQLQCISGCLSRRDNKWELALFVQVTTAVFISGGFHSAVVTCPNKDNSHFLSLLDNQPEIHCNLKYTVHQSNTTIPLR